MSERRDIFKELKLMMELKEEVISESRYEKRKIKSEFKRGVRDAMKKFLFYDSNKLNKTLADGDHNERTLYRLSNQHPFLGMENAKYSLDDPYHLGWVVAVVFRVIDIEFFFVKFLENKNLIINYINILIKLKDVPGFKVNYVKRRVSKMGKMYLKKLSPKQIDGLNYLVYELEKI